MEKIKPKVKKDIYELEDAEYLLIESLRELTKAIENLTVRATK